ncbi:MAG TPA: c-type cytochrome [Rhodocyclaceae bacterium]|jgi:cytochrome c553
MAAIKRVPIKPCLPILIGFLALPLMAQEQSLAARSLAATCAGCHGTNGNAVPGSGIEALAGSPKERLLQKLQDFRADTKPATIMNQISKGYSEEQLALIAEYFSMQKPKKAAQK